MNKQRIYWVDMLRILATWGVISIHGKSRYIFNIGEPRWYEYNLIGFSFTFCVPVFLLLSGYLMLQKQTSIHDIIVNKVSKVILMEIISIFLCSCAGALVALVNASSIWEGIRNSSIKWGFGTSYLAVLGGCYLVVPFLEKIVEEQKNEEYFLILSVFFCFIIPTFTELDYVRKYIPSAILFLVDFIESGQVYMPVGAVAIFVLGHYLGKVSENTSKRTATLLLAICFGVWITASFYQTAYPEKQTIISVLRYGKYYGGYVSPFLLMYSASIFIFFKVVISEYDISEMMGKIINHIGRNAVMIFLLHGIVISIVRPHIPVFWIESFLLETIVNTSLYFAIALAISLVLERIPIINKVL